MLISSTIAFVVIKSSINSFACQVFQGKSKDDNRRLAQLVLAEYKKIKVTASNEQFIQAHLERRLLYDWGNELYVIFDSDRVLINFSSLGLFATTQPFRFLGDRKFEKELIDKFTLLAHDSNSHKNIGTGVEGKETLFTVIGFIAWSLVIIGFISLIIRLFVR